jgi:hypothetical protein
MKIKTILSLAGVAVLCALLNGCGETPTSAPPATPDKPAQKEKAPAEKAPAAAPTNAPAATPATPPAPAAK